jgi:hypothetical protein
LAWPACLFWLNSYAACHRLVVLPQSGANYRFQITIY